MTTAGGAEAADKMGAGPSLLVARATGPPHVAHAPPRPSGGRFPGAALQAGPCGGFRRQPRVFWYILSPAVAVDFQLLEIFLSRASRGCEMLRKAAVPLGSDCFHENQPSCTHAAFPLLKGENEGQGEVRRFGDSYCVYKIRIEPEL